MTQLAITVTSKGFGFLEACLMSLKRMPRTVGYIMKNSRMPIGIDSLPNLRESMNCPNCGKNLPTSNPATMHIAIQSVRYFSKMPSDFSFSSDADSLVNVYSSQRVMVEQIEDRLSINLYTLPNQPNMITNE
jgi:hypothetical protein